MSIARVIRLSPFIELVMARCKLWPKHGSQVQFSFLIAATMLDPLSEVAQASLFLAIPMTPAHPAKPSLDNQQCGLQEQRWYVDNETAIPIPY